MPARSTISPVTRPVSLPSDDLQGVGGGEVQPEPLLEVVGDLGEPAGDHAHLVAEPLERADQRAGARASAAPPARTLSTTDASSPASSATRACSDCSKSSSPRIAGRRDLGDLVLAARVRREELDHLVLDERGVHVHDHQPLRPALQARPAPRRRRPRCRRPPAPARCAARSVSAPETANSTAVTGYFASRKMRSMLPPVPVILAAMAAVDSAVSGWPSTVTWERPSPRGRLSPMPEMISACSFIDSAQLCTVARSSPSGRRPGGRGHQGAQHDAAPGDDLLDVDHVDAVGGEGVEEPGGDAGPVLAEDLDEEGGHVAAGTAAAGWPAMRRSWCFHGIGHRGGDGDASRLADTAGGQRRPPSAPGGGGPSREGPGGGTGGGPGGGGGGAPGALRAEGGAWPRGGDPSGGCR